MEGVWQELKVFKEHDIDATKFQIKCMKGIKKLSYYFGQLIGHRNG